MKRPLLAASAALLISAAIQAPTAPFRISIAPPGSNSDIDYGAVGVAAALLPEPASWSLLILGFGGVGGLIRARRRKTVQSVA